MPPMARCTLSLVLLCALGAPAPLVRGEDRAPTRDARGVRVTGDFNSTEDAPQYRTLTAGDDAGVRLTDAYREVAPRRLLALLD